MSRYRRSVASHAALAALAAGILMAAQGIADLTRWWF